MARIVRKRDVALLDALLAEDVVFTAGGSYAAGWEGHNYDVPQGGDARFLRETFRYVREVVGESDAVLEFETEIDGISINGVDMISLERRGPHHRIQSNGPPAQGHQPHP